MKKIIALFFTAALSISAYSYQPVTYHVTESQLDTIATITSRVEKVYSEGWVNDSIVKVDTFLVRKYKQWTIVEYDNSGKEIRKTKIYKDLWHKLETKYLDGFNEITCYDLTEHERIIKTRCNYEIVFLKDEQKQVPFTSSKMVPRFVSGYYPVTVYDTVYEAKYVDKCVEKTRNVEPKRIFVEYTDGIYDFNYIYYDQFLDENGYWRLYIKMPDKHPLFGQQKLNKFNVDGIVIGDYNCKSDKRWDHQLTKEEIIYEIKKYFSKWY